MLTTDELLTQARINAYSRFDPDIHHVSVKPSLRHEGHVFRVTVDGEDRHYLELADDGELQHWLTP